MNKDLDGRLDERSVLPTSPFRGSPNAVTSAELLNGHVTCPCSSLPCTAACCYLLVALRFLCWPRTLCFAVCIAPSSQVLAWCSCFMFCRCSAIVVSLLLVVTKAAVSLWVLREFLVCVFGIFWWNQAQARLLSYVFFLPAQAETTCKMFQVVLHGRRCTAQTVLKPIREQNTGRNLQSLASSSHHEKKEGQREGEGCFDML